jgi:hypothetical protein
VEILKREKNKNNTSSKAKLLGEELSRKEDNEISFKNIKDNRQSQRKYDLFSYSFSRIKQKIRGGG